MRNKLIVLVEDDLNLRQSIALILQRAGFFVTATDCVHKALGFIQSESYHMLIADINMPGTEKVLLPGLLGTHPELSIVILTDQSASEIEKEDKLLSAHYLIKPIAPERLLDCVGTIMGSNSHRGIINGTPVP